MDAGEEQVVYSWDLTHDYNLEYFPDEIDRCLQTALEAKHVKSLVLPHYTGFSKSRMTVSVEVSTLPVQLRKVIGNRAWVEKYGATLMKTLIQGYLTLRASKTALRGLQPTTIYISEGATRAHFVDLLSMTSWYTQPKH